MKKLYTPWQIWTMSFLGGPVAMIYGLYQNYIMLNKEDAASKVIMYGVPFIALLFCVIPFFPLNFPNALIPVASAFFGKALVEKDHMKKQDIISSGLFQTQAIERTAGVTILSAITTLIGILLIVKIYSVFGIV